AEGGGFMPFAKRGDVVHSEATSGFNNQKKSLLINGLAALGDSHHPLQIPMQRPLTPTSARGFLFSGFTA
ncbi:hypothetical protein JTM53_30180, partial [Pseudomonas aeruginosa]|nr:hypothetical protein [Pseudomonas aeruginosa]